MKGKRSTGEEWNITTGNEMQDTLSYDFIARAHPFVHKANLACPDMGTGESPRKRLGETPLVDAKLFFYTMNRRIENQCRGSWSYNYTLANMNFRLMLNECQRIYSVASQNSDVALADIPKCAIEIIQAMKGTYEDPSGHRRPVRGDVTKLHYANISPMARKLVHNVRFCF
jgi:hypothetical protein